MSRDLDLVLKWFERYYRECPLEPPGRFGRREFAFMFFDKGYVQRHLSFSRVTDIREFFTSRVPAHAYHSSAYYINPGAPTMEEKSWLGADLIFDLDADHIRGTEGLPYDQMLAEVKREFIRLIDEFLLGDLGFGESDLKIVFSGGRGYHAHVSADDVLQLRSHERREIVDYISGTDLDMGWVFDERATFEKDYGERRYVHRVRLIPPPSSGGWRLRMRRGLDALLEDLRALAIEDIRGSYPSTREVSDRLMESLREEVLSRRGEGDVGQHIMSKGNLEDLSGKNQALIMGIMENDVKQRLAGQVDEPVTSDIKRLIRIPGSLHGKTSLRVTELDRDCLQEFEPLRDAVPTIFPEAPIRVVVEEPVDLELRGERFRLDGEGEVPIYAALFLLCRRQASLAQPV